MQTLTTRNPSLHRPLVRWVISREQLPTHVRQTKKEIGERRGCCTWRRYESIRLQRGAVQVVQRTGQPSCGLNRQRLLHELRRSRGRLSCRPKADACEVIGNAAPVCLHAAEAREMLVMAAQVGRLGVLQELR